MIALARRRQPVAWLVASVSTLGVCGAAAAQTRESTPVEEVVVTAQKHQQRLQDVPIAITVLGGGQLDAFTGDGVSEALTLVPGVATTESVQSGGTQLAMRGVAAGGPLFSGSSPIAYLSAWLTSSSPFRRREAEHERLHSWSGTKRRGVRPRNGGQPPLRTCATTSRPR